MPARALALSTVAQQEKAFHAPNICTLRECTLGELMSPCKQSIRHLLQSQVSALGGPIQSQAPDREDTRAR